ncbi:hypothetical protein [Sulfolobus monocaudavirus SMV3]|nr:hypothetical protein AXI69_gp70 [Sulfolobus monocaudavirus SMV3]ALG97007.1 hypothetical protein [Sulfolobus monocaudavirus SMV3]
MNCLEYLSEKYNLRGYSPDTYLILIEATNLSPDECESLFAYAEATYG